MTGNTALFESGPSLKSPILRSCSHNLMAFHETLPYVDPRARRGPLYRAFARFSGTRFAMWLSPKIVWKLDPHLMRLTGGRVGMGLMLPTALLETRGAHTGHLRRNGVIYFHDGERVTIIASKLGHPRPLLVSQRSRKPRGQARRPAVSGRDS